MTKWEYCRIMWVESRPMSSEKADIMPSVFAVEDQPYTDTVLVTGGTVQFLGSKSLNAIPDLDAGLSALGKEGWELVSHTPRPHGELFYFKRPM